jgi:hypothetical protein
LIFRLIFFKSFEMKKFAMSAIVAAAMAGTAAHAAGSDTATFDVTLTLTPTCIVTTTSGGAKATAVGDINIAYSAFQTTAGTGSTNFYVRCSTSLNYGVALDASNGIVDGTTGLSYNLALKTANTGDASTAVGSLTGQTGVAAGTQYFVQAYVGPDQPGTNTPGTANKTRTITVSY